MTDRIDPQQIDAVLDMLPRTWAPETRHNVRAALQDLPGSVARTAFQLGREYQKIVDANKRHGDANKLGGLAITEGPCPDCDQPDYEERAGQWVRFCRRP